MTVSAGGWLRGLEQIMAGVTTTAAPVLYEAVIEDDDGLPAQVTEQDWAIALLCSAERSDRALAGWGIDTGAYLERLALHCEKFPPKENGPAR